MPKVVNLIGQTFGLLTVLSKDETKCTGGKAEYTVKCDCGEIMHGIRGTNMTWTDPKRQVAHTRSCQKCKASIGEKMIVKTLTENGIATAMQITFPDCKKIKPLPFDVAAIDENKKIIYIVEFDGIQHFQAIGYFGGDDNLQRNIEYDKIKNEYCKAHNIPLIRIPYWERDKMTIEMLTPKTSPYLME